jgi:hypothetical protein
LITVLNIRYKLWRSLLSPKIFVPFVLLILAGNHAKAQVVLGSLTINSNPVIAVTSVSDYENGVAVTDQTLTITTNASMNWVLKVRAAANLDRMGTQIPVNNIGMKVTNLPGAAPEIILTTADQDIASGTSVAVMQSIPVEIRYRAIAGNSFLQPAGDYSTSLTFTLTMVNL